MIFIVVRKKGVKMFTKRALSPLDKSVAKNHDDEDDDDVVNHGIKSHTNQNL